MDEQVRLLTEVQARAAQAEPATGTELGVADNAVIVGGHGKGFPSYPGKLQDENLLSGYRKAVAVADDKGDCFETRGAGYAGTVEAERDSEPVRVAKPGLFGPR